MLRTITLTTTHKEEVVDITEEVAKIVKEAGLDEAGVFVYVPHGDAAVNIQAKRATSSNPPLNSLLKKVLEKGNFEEPETGAAFVAPTEVLIASEGKLLLGEDQRILFYEFNGPRKRFVHVLVIPSPKS